MKTKELTGSSALILGYGREGKSMEQWLTHWYSTIRIGIADKTRSADYLSHLARYDTIIRSPGVSPYVPEIIAYAKMGGHVTSATNIFFSLCPGMTIGVTGTKGKSTTASLIAHILSSKYPDVRLVGNIGIPMLDHLEGATKETIFVMELSSHQLADVHYSPHVAVLLPIVPEHQDYYPDVATYASAKKNITNFQTDKDFIIYDESNTDLDLLVGASHAQKYWYTSKEKTQYSSAWFQGKAVMLHDREVVLQSDIKLLGNKHSLLAAATVGDICKLSPVEIGSSMKTFRPLPHRLEFAGEKNAVRYVNDSLATIPEATVHALDALGADVATLIAGGFDRHLSYEVLGSRLVNSSITTLILFPDTGKRIWEALVKAQPKTAIKKYTASSMSEAVRIAAERTPKGKICLLSPASASFNMFRDYVDRGEQFKECVRKLE